MAFTSKPISIANVKDGQAQSNAVAYSWSGDGWDRFTPIYPKDNLLVNTKSPSLTARPCVKGSTASTSNQVTIPSDGVIELRALDSAKESYYRFMSTADNVIINTPLIQGRTYTLGFQIKSNCNVINNYVGLRAEYKREGGTWEHLDAPWNNSVVPANGSEWTYYEQQITIPENIVGFHFGLDLRGVNSTGRPTNGAWLQLKEIKLVLSDETAYPYTPNSEESPADVYPLFRGEGGKKEQPNLLWGTSMRKVPTMYWNSTGGNTAVDENRLRVFSNTVNQYGVIYPPYHKYKSQQWHVLEFEARGTSNIEVFLMSKVHTKNPNKCIKIEPMRNQTDWQKVQIPFYGALPDDYLLGIGLLVRGTGNWFEIKANTMQLVHVTPEVQGNQFTWDKWDAAEEVIKVSTVNCRKIQLKPNTFYAIESDIPVRTGNMYDCFVFPTHEVNPSSQLNGIGFNYWLGKWTDADGILEVGIRDTVVPDRRKHTVRIQEVATTLPPWDLNKYEPENAIHYEWTRWTGTGSEGVYVVAQEVEFTQSTNGQTPPSTGWVKDKPKPVIGMWQWQRVRDLYSNTTVGDWVYSSTYYGKDNIVISATEPTEKFVGMLWQTKSGTVVKEWTGTQWVTWGINADNMVADNVTVQNGVFQRIEGVEVLGGRFYTEKTEENPLEQGNTIQNSVEITNGMMQIKWIDTFYESQIDKQGQYTVNQNGMGYYVSKYDPNQPESHQSIVYDMMLSPMSGIWIENLTNETARNRGGSISVDEFGELAFRQYMYIDNTDKQLESLVVDRNLWERYGTSENQEPMVYRQFGWVQLKGAMKNKADIANGDLDKTVIFKLPDWARPKVPVRMRQQGSSQNTFLLDVYPNGEVKFSRYGATSGITAPKGSWFNICISYLGADLYVNPIH